MQIQIPEFIYTKDGQGDYIWDRFLWVLAGGVIVVIVAAILLMDHFTPPAQGGERPAQTAPR